MSTPSNQPRSTLAGYTPQEVESIVAVRCQELSAHLGWPLAPPAVKVVEPDALREAMHADVNARAEKIRGAPREEGLLSTLASWLLSLLSPSVFGYFGTSHNTLYLNGELVPQQAGYVLMHELTHAAQWQNFPALFARIDAGRVAAEDLAEKHGDDSPEAAAARDRYESLVTFVEGHATLHARRACEARLLRDAPNVSAADAHAFVEAMMGLDLTDETTQLIYVRGETKLAELDSARVQALFGAPEEIEKLFTRR